jgi:hypothetical protein
VGKYVEIQHNLATSSGHYLNAQVSSVKTPAVGHWKYIEKGSETLSLSTLDKMEAHTRAVDSGLIQVSKRTD